MDHEFRAHRRCVVRPFVRAIACLSLMIAMLTGGFSAASAAPSMAGVSRVATNDSAIVKVHHSAKWRRAQARKRRVAARRRAAAKRRYAAKRRAAARKRYAKKRYAKKRYAKKRSSKARRSAKRSRTKRASGRVVWAASSKCLAGNLRAVVYRLARIAGRVRVNSTCRSRSRNRRVGGASRSWHLTGNAVDVRVFGNIRASARYLRKAAGGYKHYGGGLFHIDNGPKRTW